MTTLPVDCWALALGGTRRAYLAQGGVLTQVADLRGYFVWVEAAQRALLAQLYDLGINTVIAVGRIPGDRGAPYAEAAQQGTLAALMSDERMAFYRHYGLQVTVAGDHAQIGAALGIADFPARCAALTQTTAAYSRGRLIYLLRGDWVDAAEEAAFGYALGHQLGRPPTRDELVRAYYGMDVAPLTAYVGSGRPRIGFLRPPFLSGQEDCYWSATSPLRLNTADWRRIIDDHRIARRTHSARTYPTDQAALVHLTDALQARDHTIIGVGRQHSLGFWEPTFEET